MCQSMSWNCPPGVNELPNDQLEEQEYIFEVCGEITVPAYSEEDAEYQLEENLREILADAVRDGSIEIR